MFKICSWWWLMYFKDYLSVGSFSFPICINDSLHNGDVEMICYSNTNTNSNSKSRPFHIMFEHSWARFYLQWFTWKKLKHPKVITLIIKCGMELLIYPKLERRTNEVWEWISKFTPHFVMGVLTYACCDQNCSMLVDMSIMLRIYDWC